MDTDRLNQIRKIIGYKIIASVYAIAGYDRVSFAALIKLCNKKYMEELINSGCKNSLIQKQTNKGEKTVRRARIKLKNPKGTD